MTQSQPSAIGHTPPHSPPPFARTRSLSPPIPARPGAQQRVIRLFTPPTPDPETGEPAEVTRDQAIAEGVDQITANYLCRRLGQPEFDDAWEQWHKDRDLAVPEMDGRYSDKIGASSAKKQAGALDHGKEKRTLLYEDIRPGADFSRGMTVSPEPPAPIEETHFNAEPSSSSHNTSLYDYPASLFDLDAPSCDIGDPFVAEPDDPLDTDLDPVDDEFFLDDENDGVRERAPETDWVDGEVVSDSTRRAIEILKAEERKRERKRRAKAKAMGPRAPYLPPRAVKSGTRTRKQATRGF